ncbi:MAG TPA: hypothetical protein VJS64_13380 [Pyrinomonadaceae bacterium]|nr:hypothetical protein [Pyrinomonadaceae bacterium]
MNAKGKFLLAGFVVVAFMSVSVRAQKVVPLAPFNSVELRNGTHAILQHGATQRVTLLKGSLDYTGVTIVDGGRLVVDRCKSECPRGYDLEIEIVTPDIARVSIADGGWIQSRGSFPRQAEMAVAVKDGGTIDIRSIPVGSVTASVYSGGRIFTRPLTAMSASVVDGGLITYWGDARVSKSIKGGGVVTRGTAAEAGQPLSDLSPRRESYVPPVPPVPPLQPVRDPRR